jgi:hypothetical protein
MVGITGWEGLDDEAMPGGYYIGILMAKLPGEQIKYRDFWRKPLEEREAIRRSSKTALMYVQLIWQWSAKLTQMDTESKPEQTKEDIRQAFKAALMWVQHERL